MNAAELPAASAGLSYFTPRSIEAVNADVAPAVATTAKVVSTIALIVGVIACINFLILHGAMDHAPYRWPWTGRTFRVQCSLTAATLHDFCAPLLIGGVIACRTRARHATRFLRCGLYLYVTSQVIFAVLNLSSPDVASKFPLRLWQNITLTLGHLTFSVFLVVLLTRRAVMAEFLPPAESES